MSKTFDVDRWVFVEDDEEIKEEIIKDAMVDLEKILDESTDLKLPLEF